ncbi:helix-turn-helix transcriptional regulator [Streptomyces sp. NPDC054765]
MVLAADPLTRESVVTYFQGCARVRLLPPDSRATADVIVLFADDVTAETVTSMRHWIAEARHPEMRMVVVGHSIRESVIAQAGRFHLATFLLRSRVGMADVLDAVLSTHEHRAQFPAAPTKSPLAKAGSLPAAAEHEGLSPADFSKREIAVLTMLADGLSTSQTADGLNCSERTVNAILAGMKKRMQLRSRAHVVAHAVRSGAI